MEIPMKKGNFWSANSTKVFLKLIFKFLFIYLDEFLSILDGCFTKFTAKTEEEKSKHLELVFEKIREAFIKLKMSKYKNFSRKK